jgi:hypothetical protein
MDRQELGPSHHHKVERISERRQALRVEALGLDRRVVVEGLLANTSHRLNEVESPVMDEGVGVAPLLLGRKARV